MLSATSLDITRLHPFVTVRYDHVAPHYVFSNFFFHRQICWYLAAVVQVQLCKYFIEIGDTDRESTVWGEINVLRYAYFSRTAYSGLAPTTRFAMLAYGQRSPIGSKYRLVHVFHPFLNKTFFSTTGAPFTRPDERDCQNDGTKAAT